MLKRGFTLAEVLVTLTIIGVIAAITLPSLLSNTATAQIGPKLAKAVSMFEQANTALLNEYSVDILSDSGLLGTGTTTITGAEGEPEEVPVDGSSAYILALGNHLRVSAYDDYAAAAVGGAAAGCTLDNINNGSPMLANDGTVYIVFYTGPENSAAAPHKQHIGTVYIDINGDNKPNEYGTDVFAFSFWNDGSLRPAGGHNWMDSDAGCKYEELCPNGKVATDYRACTGSIFENNLKVLYK